MAGNTVTAGRRGTLPGLYALLFFIFSGALAACGGETEQGSGQGGTTTAQASGDTWSYELPGEEVYPEGVVYDRSSGDYFVGSTSNGEIFRGSVKEGGGSADVFLEGGRDDRSSAIGLELNEDGSRLFVSGGDTGGMFVYDTGSGDLVDSFQNGQKKTFINDVAVVPSGDAYFTDSFSPVLYRLAATGDGYEFEEYLDLTETPIKYQDGFNLNGIVATGDGRYLIVTHSGTGQLFRIDTRNKKVTEIDLGGDKVAGDGMVLDGRTLYAVAGGGILPVQLSKDFTNGEVGEGFSGSSFKSPTTIAEYNDRMLVVNSQFDARESGNPDLPFTISDIPIP
ncbi:MAG TPA: hypothetical protein VFJ72_12155 [Rubrobacteraceae bacterium]|nr:hypothetical protein [Rubrobacteraceae bacterium]